MKKKRRYISMILAMAMILTVIEYTPAKAAETTYTSGEYQYTLNEDNEATITKYTGNDANLVIPGMLDGKKVIAIAGSVFRDRKTLISVDFPDNITYIGSYAFSGCTKLTKIDLPNSLQTLKYRVFYNTGITEVTIPKSLKEADSSFEDSKVTDVYFETGSTQVAGGLFQGCITLKSIHWENTISQIGANAFSSTSVTSVDFPDGITYMGSYAFSGCTKLTEIDLPNSLQTLKYRVFYNTGITEVTIPKSLKEADSSFEDSKVTDVYFETGSKGVTGALFDGCSTLRNVTFPDEMETIGKNAFSGCKGIHSLTLPISIKTIGAYAFANCTGLEQIFVNRKIKSTDSTAFNNCPNLNVQVSKYTDSTISLIDAGANIKFTSTNYPDSIDKALWHEKSQFEVNDSSATDYVMINLDYAVKKNMESKVSNMKLITKLPESSDIAYIKMDGITLTTNEYSVSNNNKVTIPVTKTAGKCRIFITPNTEGKMIGYSKLTYKKNGVECSDMIGAVSEECSCLTLGTNEEVSYKKGEYEVPVTVRGYGIKGKNLEIYVDGVLRTELMVSNTGKYSAQLMLDAPENFKKYKIKVKSQNKAGIETEIVKEIQTVENGPKLTQLSLYIEAHDYKNGHNTFDLLNDRDTINYITFQNAKPYQFAVSYDNRESVEKVYVISTRNGIQRKLEAKWNEEKNAYVTKGYFNNDTSYVPGNISIEHIPKSEETIIQEDGTVILTDREKAGIPENWSKAKAKQITDAEDDFKAEITLNSGDIVEYSYNKLSFKEYADELEGSTSQEDKSVQHILQDGRAKGRDVKKDLIDILKVFDESGTAGTLGDVYELLEEYGFSKYISGEDNLKENVAFIKTECTPDAIRMYMLDPASSEKNICTYLIKKGKKQTEKTIFQLMGIDGTSAGFMIDSANSIFEFGGQTINLMMMKQEVMCDTSLSEAQRQQKLEEIQKMVDIECEKLIFNYIASVIGAVGAMAPPFSGVSIACGLTSLVIKKCIIPMIKSGDFDDFLHGSISLSVLLLRWIIDPSGYVYEGVTSNRVSGAKMTLYYKEKFESSGSVIWDAAEYDQDNPLISDDTGAYAWDVPEGYWRVKAEKDGYETAYSDWMEVPPPRMDVYIKMKRTDEPVITDFHAYNTFAKVSFSQYMEPKSVENLLLQDNEGKNIAFNLIYDTGETDAQGTVFAKDYTLSYIGAKPSGEITLTGTSNVKSADDVGLKEVIQTDGTKKDIKIVCNDYVNLKADDIYELNVKISGGHTSNLTAEIEHGTIAEILNVEKTDSEGQYRLSLKGHLYGETSLKLSIDESGIEKVIPIAVGNVTESGTNVSDGILELIPDASVILNENQMITGLYQNQNSVGELRQQFSTLNIIFKSADGKILEDTEPVGTGTEINVLQNDGTVNMSYYFVLSGDINGDGKVNGKDVSVLARSLVGKETLTEVQEAAAELFEDGSINGKDVSKLAQSLVGKATIPSQGK